MAPRRSPGEIADELRRFAEGKSKSNTGNRLELLHELQVYHEELTVQNDELILAQQALEETRDRFVDLYDFAPVGYLTLDANGVIVQLNFAAATLLGKVRQNVEGMPLLGFIRRADRASFLDYIRRCKGTSDEAEAVETEFRLITAKEPFVRFSCHPRTNRNTGRREFLTTVRDVTAMRLLEEERQRLSDARAVLAGRLMTVQEDERRRIARDLHDNIGQQITTLRLTLDAMALAAAENPTSRLVGQAHAIVAKIDEQLDFIVSELRPMTLDLGFVAAIEHFVIEWSNTFGIPAEFHAMGLADSRLRPEAETHLYRVVQEALNNVYKHAGAKRVSVVIERRAQDVVLIVEDDGRGFMVESAGPGFGLVGMRERALLIGGKLEIESTPNRGTTLFLRVAGATTIERRREQRK